ncbi:unnamed protein product [Brassica rapa subsp. trilocularis]
MFLQAYYLFMIVFDSRSPHQFDRTQVYFYQKQRWTAR